MKGTIVLVEDDEDARSSLGRSLVRSGFDVLLAADVVEALSLCDRAHFVHAVVSDLVLGADESGGIELLSALRARGISAPVIVITAFASVDTVKGALNHGAAFLLEKPFRASELVEVLERCVTAAPSISYTVERTLTELELTDKELAIARYLLKGLTSIEIARLEQNSDKTIRQHISRIYAKCGVASRAEFFHFVYRF